VETGAPWQPVLSNWQRTERHRGSRPTDILFREWERVRDFMHVNLVAAYNIIVCPFSSVKTKNNRAVVCAA
jgi:hypothetical protein